jgi:thiol-disulfide isomerase/thioredoxin
MRRSASGYGGTIVDADAIGGWRCGSWSDHPPMRLLALAWILLAQLAAADPWRTDLATAQAEAAAAGRDVAVLFTGSDWCPPCMHMEEAIFSQSAFHAAVADRLILVKLDFPRQRPMDPEVLAVQEAAMRRLALEQAFPTLLLLDTQGRPYAQAERVGPGPGSDPARYGRDLVALIPRRESRDQALAAAATRTGADRARALAAVLEPLAQAVSLTAYADQVDAILAADADGAAGLYGTWAGRRASDDVTAISEAGDIPGALAALTPHLTDARITGRARQRLLILQGNLHFSNQDRASARESFRAAIAADPQSDDVTGLESVVRRLSEP